MNKKLLAAILFSTFLLTACGEATAKYAAVAQCLTDKGVKMYGAYWCSHCANQKKQFGADFKYVTYVECDANGQNANVQECKDQGIQSFPTWFFPGQDKVVGETPIETLAEKANCKAALNQTLEEYQASKAPSNTTN